jgi:pimeloyl-ACP methyl ester carboxylesterase
MATTPADVLGDPVSLQLSVGEVECHLMGAGRPMVFLHGLMVNAAHWRQVLPWLQGDFHCVVPTLPLGSHSLPTRTDRELSLSALASSVEELMDMCGVEDAVVVGSDTGTMVAQLLMARASHRVTDVVLLPGDTYETFSPWDVSLRRQRNQHRPLPSRLRTAQ